MMKNEEDEKEEEENTDQLVCHITY
jgi:hypothetical protein